MLSVELLDGKTPVKQAGDLHWDSLRIYFTAQTTGNDISIPVHSLKEIQRKEDSFKVTFHAGNDTEIQFFIPVQTEALSFIDFLQAKRINPSFFTGKRLIFSALAMLPIAYFLFWGLLGMVPKVIPETWDVYTGKQVSSQIREFTTPCYHQELETYLSKKLKSLTPESSPYPYQLHILDSDQVNAFALPGGQIYFFSGLLKKAKTEEEVNSVLAHEIAHVELRHGLQKIVRMLGVTYMISVVFGAGFEELEWVESLHEIAGILSILKYSRDMESEADLYAVNLLKNKQLPATGLISFLKSLSLSPKEKGTMSSQTLEWLSSHPSSDNRIQKIKQAIASPALSSEKITPWTFTNFSCHP